MAGPVRFWELVPADRIRVSPNIVRLKSLNPLRDKSPSPKGWWDSVRGLKCLQRHDLMFKKIWLRSTGVEDDRGDEDEEKLAALVESEVLFSEVLALWSEELRSGETCSSSSGSESRLWVRSSAMCALSNKILKAKSENCWKTTAHDVWWQNHTITHNREVQHHRVFLAIYV